MSPVRRLIAVFSLLLFVLFLSLPGYGQLGGLLGKKKPQEPSDKPPEYSEADKKMLAEIAERPAIQDEVQKQWDERRRADLQSAFNINQTVSWAITTDPMQSHAISGEGQRLYSNPLLQSELNIIGQRLVPKDSPNLYTFRIVADPMPRAEALTTGTIYISTGLISMLDSEAQLSYILAHEVAHIERQHAYNRIRNQILEDALYREKEAKSERNKALIGIAGTIGGSLIGGGIGGGRGAVIGGGIGALGGFIAGQLLFNNHMQLTEWNTVEEDEADELGVKYMLDQGYDAREIPRLYASLDRMVGKDTRLGLGFMGNPRRVRERITHVQQILNGPMKENLAALVSSGHITGSNAGFTNMLAAAKRDNGILAMEYDLFAMAKSNLEEAAEQRSNDPTVQFYLGRVMAMTAHSQEDRRAALEHVSNAIQLDAARGALPDVHLENALTLLQQNNPSNRDQVVRELQTYLVLYQRDHSGSLPGNMYAIIDYFNLVGETSWYLPPGWYPGTQLNTPSASAVIAPDTVLRKASTATTAAAAAAEGASPAHVKPVGVKK